MGWPRVRLFRQAGVLCTPKVPTNKAFYLRKLKTYCYGLYSGQAEQNSLCFWDETIAAKGCNEVISSAHEFFTIRRTGASHLAWWGDNTSSQMKNQFLMLYNNELVREDGFSFYQRIDNKYSPPGHTFMENDRAFGVIARKAKKTAVIGSPKAWMRLAAKAKAPKYHTMFLDQPKFRDWKTYLSAKYKRPSVWKNTDGEAFKIMKVRWLNYGVGELPDGTLESHPDEVWYRMSLDTNEPWKKINLERNQAPVGVISDPAYDLHDGPLPLPPKKVRQSTRKHTYTHIHTHTHTHTHARKLVHTHATTHTYTHLKVKDLAKFRAWLPKEFHSLYPDPRRM